MNYIYVNCISIRLLFFKSGWKPYHAYYKHMSAEKTILIDFQRYNTLFIVVNQQENSSQIFNCLTTGPQNTEMRPQIHWMRERNKSSIMVGNLNAIFLAADRTRSKKRINKDKWSKHHHPSPCLKINMPVFNKQLFSIYLVIVF